MDSLKDILTNKIPSIRTLPILHSCEAAFLAEILTTSELKTSLCNVFNENYLYTFYGIPSYRKNRSVSSGNPGFLPVCFIFDYEKIPDLDRLFPFDTGAFHKLPEIKERHFHTSAQLENFELNPSIEEAKKLIDYFYGNNEKYISNKPIKSVDDIDSSKFNVWGYASLINDKSSSSYDNRVATFEFIYNKPIQITNDNLIQVILPATFLDNSNIYTQITSKYGINDPMKYATIKGDPQEYFGSIYNMYINFINTNSLV